MRNSIFKRGFVFIILFFLIGASVVPIISGNTAKIDIRTSKGTLIGSPLNDDYVNAYWKFDECYGDTVKDSSEHSYDGTRFGATWTTDGYLGCALIFDGFDDFVDLSLYSSDIGFNKTDDAILSFYFKSTDGGLIYSATAPWGYSPEFRIELLSNGSLLFYLITQLCGIILYSSGTYDDGDWHYVEYHFNGITSNPTLTLYVDNNLDCSVTHWLCEIESDDFAKTKIGMHAHNSSDYFDGYIDELKFIKYEQGNKQEPPTIDGPIIGKPNVEYEYSFITDDPEGDDISLDIDWGDGTIDEDLGPFNSGEEAIVSHKWTEEGSYGIKAKSSDVWHNSRWSDPYDVKIGNQPPDKPTIKGQRYGDPQQQLTYTFVANDFDEDDVRYFIDWDDGTTTETSYYSSGEEVTETHSWETNSDYYIKARGIDTENKEGDWSELYHIRIGDQPPSTPTINGEISSKPEAEVDFIFSANDPENDQVWFDIKWGDGNEIIDDGPYNSGQAVTKSYAWSKTSTYIIEARARDEFGHYGEWESHSIKIPRNNPYTNNLLELLFERFPSVFMILRFLLRL